MSREYEFRGFYPRREQYCPICGEELRMNDTVFATPGHSVYGCEYCMTQAAAEADGLDAITAEKAWI